MDEGGIYQKADGWAEEELVQVNDGYGEWHHRWLDAGGHDFWHYDKRRKRTEPTLKNWRHTPTQNIQDNIWDSELFVPLEDKPTIDTLCHHIRYLRNEEHPGKVFIYENFLV